jgi:hypothetical protein
MLLTLRTPKDTNRSIPSMRALVLTPVRNCRPGKGIDPKWRRLDAAAEDIAALQRFLISERERISLRLVSDDSRTILCAMSQPTTQDLLRTDAKTFNTETLTFSGLRGDPRRHLDRRGLLDALEQLPAAPLDAGKVDLMVARGDQGERILHRHAILTSGGMPGDRWSSSSKYGPEFQLATTRTDFARVVANGQPLELHGDNLFLTLDLSTRNLPTGSLLRVGEALLRVTPQAHNGCKKWVQRFGLACMKFNLEPEYQEHHLRGIYLQVVEPGRVALDDRVVVLRRGLSPPT